MNTSYFRKSGDDPNAVSIARWSPSWLPGIRKMLELAPPVSLLSKWRAETITWAEYTEEYRREVLDRLDVRQVLEDLGPDAIICCYEKSGEPCHRHLVAAWLSENADISIPELL